MAIFTTPSIIQATYDLYFAYIANITTDTASYTALLQAQSTQALAMWRDAATAVANINAAAADNYSNGVGVSVGKADLQEKMDAAENHLADFIRLCLLGGVEVPTTTEDSIAYWDLSRGINV